MEDTRRNARRLLEKAVDFHGHLGPFLILGIRMGLIAQSLLKPQGQNDMTVVMLVKPDPPESCTVDGVQVASGCTLGKGTIDISEASDRIVGKFRARNGRCTIAVATQVLNELKDGVVRALDEAILQMAEDVMARSDAELFEVTLDA